MNAPKVKFLKERRGGPPPFIDRTGRTIGGRYRILAIISRDFAGTLYKAEDLSDPAKKKVTVKVLSKGFGIASDAVLKIDHPNICKIKEIIKGDDGITSIVVTPPSGESAQDMLKEHGQIPPGKAISAALQLLSALHAVHFQKLVVGNLNIESVFFSKDPLGDLEIRISNVGIKDRRRYGDKPYYNSPEQVFGGVEVDLRTDIWSVGVILYEMLYGKRPFEGESLDEIAGNITLKEPEYPTQSDTIPKEVVPILKKALQKQVEDRYQNVTNIIGDLLPIQEALDERMSRASVAALKDSFPPPPFEADAGAEKEPAAEKQQEYEDFRISFDDITGVHAVPPPGPPAPPAPSPELSPEPSPELSPEPSSFPMDVPAGAKTAAVINWLGRNRKLALRVGAAAGVVCVGFVLLLAVAGGSNDEEAAGGEAKESSLPRAGKKSDSKMETPPTTDPPETQAAVQATTPQKTEEQANIEQSLAPAADGDQVTITLMGLPPSARVTADKRAVASQFLLTKSSQAVEIAARAEGYHSYVEKVVPDRDLEIDLSLIMVKKKGNSDDELLERDVPGKGKGKSAGSLASNPFKK